MELITAIALLCQLNLGIGTGHKLYNPNDGYEAIVPNIIREQKSCQKELAKCIAYSPASLNRVLDCIQKRK